MALYRRLLAAYGPQGWWPARDGPFEVMVGAVLTQNTAWANVERAIEALRAADALEPRALARMPPARLARFLRPVGYFNVKAQRLRAFCRFYLEAGGLRALGRLDTAALREQLLGVHGVGPETADDILLYAFGRPVFVIDAYTRRLLARQGLARGDEPYETLRAAFERALPPDTDVYGEYHALIVAHAKAHCRVRPVCEGCPVRRPCAHARAGA